MFWLWAIILALAACATEKAQLPLESTSGPDPVILEPAKTLIPTVNIAPAKSWPQGTAPTPAPGLKVQAFARNLDHPRWLYVLPNGDVLVAETNAPPKPEDQKGIMNWIMELFMKHAGAVTPSANRITLLRDADADGVPETRTVFLENLNSPFGMALIGNNLYVANTNAILRFPYKRGQTRMTATGEKIIDLPASGRNYHWTKSMVASPDGKFLYVGVGANSNIGEDGPGEEIMRAAILKIDIKERISEVFASGLRNPVGLDWNPVNGELWACVNERDKLGSDLVPDYMTSIHHGDFFGWPYSYFGPHIDKRVKPQRPELVAKARKPDYALGPHVAPLGLTFYDKKRLPRKYWNGVFVGQHGSWNRSPPSGYKVVFIPFENGEPAGLPEDVLTGFLTHSGDAQGRPVGIMADKTGALLVADDVGNTIWRITPD